MPPYDMSRRLGAEFIGTAFLLAAVVGSGIMGERLAGGNDAIALIGNTLATGAMLMVLILVLGPVSAAHFNPAVTLAFALRRLQPWREVPGYVGAQVAGAFVGVAGAHVMFVEPLFSMSVHARTGAGQWLAEGVAAFGLVATILCLLRGHATAIPYAVGLYISAGYWFTSSTSFANPAVTLARSFTDSFSGIRLADAPAFIVAQIVGATVAAALVAWLYAAARDTEPEASP